MRLQCSAGLPGCHQSFLLQTYHNFIYKALAQTFLAEIELGLFLEQRLSLICVIFCVAWDLNTYSK
jgi:hypothetical protein